MSSIGTFPLQELIFDIKRISEEIGIEVNDLFHVLESTISQVCISAYGGNLDLSVSVNRDDGTIKLFKNMTVVDDDLPNKKIEPEDDYILEKNFGDELAIGESEVPLIFDFYKHITLKEAGKENKDISIGQVLSEDIPLPTFTRHSSMQARQILMQRIKMLQKDKQFAEFNGKVGEIVSGTVKRIEYGNVWVELTPHIEAMLRRDEMIARESFRPGERISSLVIDVNKNVSGPSILLSRTHPKFMERLFAMEVPEVYEGIVQIKSIAREPGSHAKISVISQDDYLDPVGVLVGMKGVRINSIVNELQGEKIDVIVWSEDPAMFIAQAIQPAKVQKIILDEENQKAEVVVAEDQQSIAIGRKGQNVRLASQLTGWKVDIISEHDEAERFQKDIKEKVALFVEALDIDDVIARLLYTEGFRSVKDLVDVTIEEFSVIEGFSQELAEEIQQRATTFIAEKQKAFVDKAVKLGIKDDLIKFDKLNHKQILTLAENEVFSIQDLADLATDELLEIFPDEEISAKFAEDVILECRTILGMIEIEEGENIEEDNSTNDRQF
ncbi:MAG: transcription termination factor NusA [Alphaproteobacteria bacterium]|nr:transcription termination factor NusA [Alphaproteobacteria bacterium]